MFFRDRFTAWLESHQPQNPPRLYQPAGFLGAPPVGWHLKIGRTTFVYRVPEDATDVFYIVLIERGGSRRALHSPFLDLVRLLQLVQRSESGIRWIRGHVEAPRWRPIDALSPDRILAFYRRYLTAVSQGVDHGVEWYGGDLTAFSWSAEKRKIRERDSAPQNLELADAHLNR
ncbi:hypothetical protein DB347_06240 [Opitutaceae bacterium EW11]|nr:hypothetical protein DB347_06240 [Opitutaceae bacterium EW11]